MLPIGKAATDIVRACEAIHAISPLPCRRWDLRTWGSSAH
jgi:hypothetical protein